MRFKTSTLVQVVAFVVATGSLVAVVGLTFSQVRIEDNHTYKAEFENASGLQPNVDVRGAGVTIGSVRSIDPRDGGGVVVTFTAPKDLRLTTSSTARIRYKNLTGDRYLEISPGAEAGGTLEPGETIGLSNTQPALELDDLFAGFDPLMQALDPEEVNELTANIIAVTEGQAGSVETMLANVASFTRGLSEDDELIGEAITEVARTLSTVNFHRADVDRLVVGLDELTARLAEDRTAIVGGLAGLSEAGTHVADTLTRIRPGMKANVEQLGAVAANLREQEDFVRDALDDLAEAVYNVATLGGNGSQFNFFLCGIRVSVDVPGQNIQIPGLYSDEQRCQVGPGTGPENWANDVNDRTRGGR